MSNFDEPFAKAQVLLAQGDPSAAFNALRPLITHGGPELDGVQLRNTLSLFARISEALAGPEYAASFHALAADPDDVDRIHEVAYEMYEQGQPRVAARLLTHGLEVAPGHPRLVAELTPNLEALMRNREVVEVLAASGLVDQHPVFAYSMAFNAMMIADVDASRDALATMRGMALDEQLADMAEAIEGMHVRHAALVGTAPLDVLDLVGWQLVLGGGALLHVSPEGYEDAMRGRYALVQDQHGHVRSGIESLIAVLTAFELAPEQIVAAPERGASIVAEALSNLLDVPLREWSTRYATEPGLFVADDLSAVEDNQFLQALSEHRRGQLLFAHASCWTEPFFYTPDATTLLYQHRTAPWAGGRMRIDPDTQQVTHDEADDSPAYQIAAKILDAELEPSQRPLDELIAGLRALAEVPEVHRPGLLRTSGRRTIQRTGSPVPSNFFG